MTNLYEKDMVVLKRNDPKDANVYQDGDIPCLYDLYLTENKELYFYHCGKEEWILSNLNHDKDYYELLKPIKEEVMKEYLKKIGNNEYMLMDGAGYSGQDNWIDVPEGAETFNYFGDEDNQFFLMRNGDETLFAYTSDLVWREWGDESFDGVICLWQREKESIIDKLVVDDLPEFKHGIDATLAERQAQYGCFEDVALVTENIMSILSKVRSNGLQDLPNTHRMALYMIASKMSRIVNGDFNHKDSWHDIGGYAKLIEDLI